jgi:hypothetical protein
MKKSFAFIILFVLILVGCSNTYIHFSGESKNWTGKYSANIVGNNEDGSYEFHFKNGGSGTKFRTVEININNGITSKREDNVKGVTITIPSSCKGCSVTTENKSIKVTIKWNSENEESFYLKPDKK